MPSRPSCVDWLLDMDEEVEVEPGGHAASGLGHASDALLGERRKGWLKNSSNDMRSKGFFLSRPCSRALQGWEMAAARSSGTLASWACSCRMRM